MSRRWNEWLMIIDIDLLIKFSSERFFFTSQCSYAFEHMMMSTILWNWELFASKHLCVQNSVPARHWKDSLRWMRITSKGGWNFNCLAFKATSTPANNNSRKWQSHFSFQCLIVVLEGGVRVYWFRLSNNGDDCDHHASFNFVCFVAVKWNYLDLLEAVQHTKIWWNPEMLKNQQFMKRLITSSVDLKC